MLALLLGLLAAPSLACDVDVTNRVVGWSADGSVALVRYSAETPEGQDIDLFLVDLASGEVKRTLLIMDPAETAQDRGRRWKAVEAELTAQGYSILPTAEPQALDAAIPGVELSWSKREAAGTVFWDLVALKQGKSVEVASNVWLQAPSPNHWESVKGPWTSPGRRWLVFLKQGCVGQDFRVVSVDYVKGALDAAR